MGVYLSTPNTEKTSIDQTCEKFSYGASSMQGWRMSQEDAHNCLPDFDEDTALFAVYDGHGGAEVAQYCASYLPGFIKDLKTYKEGQFSDALQEAFLGFDKLLTTPSVIKELKVLAGVESDEEETPAKKRTEADLLRQEADMPIEDLLAQYETGETAQPRTKILRKKVQINSPVIKPKKLPFPDNGSKKEDKDSSENANTNSKLNDSVLNLKENVAATDTATDTKVDNKITNGHAENENNINLEKESKMCSSISLQHETISNSADNSSSHSSKHLSDSDQSSSTSTNQKKDSDNTVGISSTSLSDQDNSAISSDSKQEQTGITSSSGKDETAGGSGLSLCDGGMATSATGSNGSNGSSSTAGVSGSQDKAKEDSEEDEDEDDDYIEDVDFSGSEDEDEDVEFDSEEEVEESEDEEDELEESDSFITEDEPHTEEPGSDSGSTAVVTLIRNKQIVVANAGDSRCILSRGGKAIELSFDHKPEDDIERERINAAGGKVTEEGRVNGGLNMSRAIGDHFYKRNTSKSAKEQMITALPDIETATLQDDDEFLVLACDGIWNSMTNQEVVDFVSEKLKEDREEKRLSLICEQLFDRCLAPNTMGDGTGCDNMTCIIVTFNKKSNNHKRPAEDSEEITDKRRKTEDLGT